MCEDTNGPFKTLFQASYRICTHTKCVALRVQSKSFSLLCLCWVKTLFWWQFSMINLYKSKLLDLKRELRIQQLKRNICAFCRLVRRSQEFLFLLSINLQWIFNILLIFLEMYFGLVWQVITLSIFIWRKMWMKREATLTRRTSAAVPYMSRLPGASPFMEPTDCR